MEENKKEKSELELYLEEYDLFEEGSEKDIWNHFLMSRNTENDFKLIFKYLREQYDAELEEAREKANEKGVEEGVEKCTEKVKSDVVKLLETIINAPDLQVRKKAQKVLDVIDLGYSNIEDILHRI